MQTRPITDYPEHVQEAALEFLARLAMAAERDDDETTSAAHWAHGRLMRELRKAARS